MSKSDLTSKIKLLKQIPGDGLLELAKNNEIEVPNQYKAEELRETIAENVNFDVISSVYKEFKDAGNTTIHLFKFPMLIKLKKQDIINKLNKNNPKNKDFSITKIENLKKENKIKIRIRAKGKEISEIDAETDEIVTFKPMIQILAILNLNDGFVEIRTRQRKFATQTAVTLSKALDKLQYEDISFDEVEIEQLIELSKTFRNATIKPLDGGISSLRMTATQKSDLNDEKIYNDRTKIIGENVRTGVYLQFNIDRKDDVRKIGCQFNANEGKIYFQTRVRETEINYVLQHIKNIKNARLQT